MKPTLRRAQLLQAAAERRIEGLRTGFSASSLALAEEDEEVEFARILVEDALEAGRVAQSYRLL